MATRAAGAEVEDTLRIAREEVEREIAFYRVILVVGLTALGWLLFLLFPERRAYRGPVFSMALLPYALLCLWRVKSGRSGAAVAAISIVVDLAIPPVFYVWVADDQPAGYTRSEWLAWMLPILIAVILLMNVLRYSKPLSIGAALYALALYVVTCWAVTGALGPPQWLAGLLLGVTGYIGIMATTRVRRVVALMAKLQLLGRYLPAHAVQRVLQQNPDAAMSVGGELVTVTLLSTDLRGFTAMSQKLEPREVVRQLNAYHASMLEQMENHGGVLDKFIGDGALMIFGLDVERRAGGEAPSSPIDAGAKQAISCARDMLAALERLNVDRVAAGLAPLKMGLGIHTGEVVSGNIGASGRVEFTVIGDAVNTASRLEGKTKELGTPALVSGDTVAHLTSREGLIEREAVTLRGRDEPIRIFEVVRH